MKYVIRVTRVSEKFVNTNGDSGGKISGDTITYDLLYDPRNMTDERRALIEAKEKEDRDKAKPRYFGNLKTAILKLNLNYGTFQNWKSKNNPSFPIKYKGFLFEKIEVK